MIISASRRTDVPAFFGHWFIRRLEEGYVIVRNPMNHSHVRQIELSPDLVDCIVFWTKNPEPFLRYLPQLDAMGYTYYFQFTLNPYPRAVEGGLPALFTRIDTFKRLARHVGPKRVVWRYDPIILGDKLTLQWHMEQFWALASELQGSTERCVFSFVDFYRKTLRNTKHLNLRPITEEEMHVLGRFIGEVGQERGMVVSTCCEELDLSSYGITKGSCIHKALVEELTGKSCGAPRDRNQRAGCGCAASVDIGAYNTCLHQCAYCYANASAKAVQDNVVKHDPRSPVLINGSHGHE
ncbi:MAG TPA: DUF1848 domain-containing protein [Firmicutes bacterium]|nr:DUF1848 domain-containing protein [Bacillota bacterium]